MDGSFIRNQSAPPPSSEAPGRPPADAPLGARFPLRILLAEDNPVNRDVIVHLLAGLGWKTDFAETGREVLRKIEDTSVPYDLILMDINMPEMNGYEASFRIVRRWPDPATRPRMIAVTANALVGDRERCLAAGMDGYLSKPVKSAELERAIIEIVLAPRFGETALASASAANTADTAPAPRSAATSGSPPTEIDAVDLEQFDMIVDGPDSPCVEVLEALAEEMPAALERLAGAARAGDAKAFADEAHQLKGSTATFGFSGFSAAISAAEEVAKCGESLQTFAAEDWPARMHAAFDGRSPRSGRI